MKLGGLPLLLALALGTALGMLTWYLLTDSAQVETINTLRILTQ